MKENPLNYVGQYSDGPGGASPAPPTGGGAGVIGGIISAGAGLYDSYQNRKAAKENTERTIQGNKEESELAYQRSLEMWHLQNAYNSPEAQMQRFKDAGLNPHLIYGRGESGQASGPPAYQPANMQHRYVGGSYGKAIASILPTLMSVGTWMQNMKLSEVDIQKKTTETDRVEQLINFLTERNPKELSKLENQLDIYPYQKSLMEVNTNKAKVAVSDMMHEFRYKFGSELGVDGLDFKYAPAGKGQRGNELLKQIAERKLKEAQASWTEYGVTSPQAIMQLVMQGVMGLAGQSLRYKKPVGVNPKNRRSGELPISRRRLHPARRVQNQR